jgi:hypothetical protein
MPKQHGGLARTRELPDTVLFGMDVAGFMVKSEKEKLALRYRMFTQLNKVVKGHGFGLRRRAPWVDQGDGALVVFPRTTEPCELVKTMAPAILEAANRNAAEPAQIRFTVHRGLTIKDSRGYWGPGPSAAFDTLDSSALRHYHRWTERLGMMAISEDVRVELGAEADGMEFLPKEGLPVTPKGGETYMVQVTPVLHNI